MRHKHLYMNGNGNFRLSNEKWFLFFYFFLFFVALSHYMNITVVSKLCDAQIGEEIMKEFFVIHSITHHPTRKKKRPDRQKTIHNFSAAMAYTLLFIFYYHLIFLIVDSENELNVWPLSFGFQVTHLRDVHKIHWQEETFWQRFKVENVNASGKVVKKT